LKYQLQVLKVHKIILVSILVSYRMKKNGSACKRCCFHYMYTRNVAVLKRV